MRHLIRIARAAWVLVVRPSPIGFMCATVLGIVLRCLTIACFFVTVQALVIAAFPERGGLLSGVEHKLLQNAAMLEQMNLAVLSAGLVVVAYLGQLVVQFIYQKFVGKLTAETTSHLRGFQPDAKIVEVRRVATVLVANSVKTSEILGFLLTLIAWAVFLGNVVSALMPLLFVAYMNRFQIAPEERALQVRFGAAYETYLRSVRRWL